MTLTRPTTPSAQASGTTYRFGRRATRGLLFGLSVPQVVAVSVAFLIALPAVYLAGIAGLAWTSPAWGLAVVIAFLPVSGQHAADVIGVQAHWLARRAMGQNVYGARILTPRPAGTLALPGDAAALRLHVDAPTGAAMVYDPHARTLTVIAAVSYRSFMLLSQADQDRRTQAWGRALATCCASGRLARIQVLQRSLPGDGDVIRAHFRKKGIGTVAWAVEEYAKLVAVAGPSMELHETTLSISLDLKAAKTQIHAEGCGVPGAAAVLRREMATFAAALRTAEITLTRWHTPEDLALTLRTAYDPIATAPLKGHRSVGRDLAAAGPVWVREHADHLVTDSGLHTVYWISQWPRTLVYATFLSPLLLAAGLRRTFSLVAQPLTTAQAVRAVRRERVEYASDAEHRARLGALPDLGVEQEWADVTQREHDLVAGHGDLRYAGFLVITAPDLPALQTGRAALEQVALQAGCETRILIGQQAQAFAAAALPLARGI